MNRARPRTGDKRRGIRGDGGGALPTNLDNLHAMLYANMRILREACTDEWVLDPEHQLYRNLPGAPGGEYGHCRAKTRERCEALSRLPFDPDTGEDYPALSCDDEHPCPEGRVCIDTLDDEGKEIKKCVVEAPYLEWRENEKQCIFGNFAHRRWCEFPKSRRDHGVPGVTDVPPFRYEPGSGRCFITPEYCEKMRVDWDPEAGECELSIGQWIGEFLLGKTIFRGIKGAGEKFAENFGGDGVHLYRSRGAIGLDADEFIAAYPEGPSRTLHPRAYKLAMMQRFADARRREQEGKDPSSANGAAPATSGSV